SSATTTPTVWVRMIVVLDWIAATCRDRSARQTVWLLQAGSGRRGTRDRGDCERLRRMFALKACWPWGDSEPPAQFLPHRGQRSIAQAIESTAKLKKFVAPKLAKTVRDLGTPWTALAQPS